MAHTAIPKQKLLNRIRRIGGQVEAIERLLEEGEILEEGESYGDILALIASTRGAMNSLMAEVIEQLIREKVVCALSERARRQSAEELVEIVGTYLK